MPSDHNPFPAPPATVLDVVAGAYGLTVADLTAHDRKSPRGEARRAAYQLLHDECHLSWPGVGLVMNRHHTTALYQARLADPVAVDRLRARIYLANGHQPSLW